MSVAATVSVPAAALLLAGFALAGCQSPRGRGPARAGVLAPCPETPNCVSSLAPDGRHRVAPLPFAGTGAEALARVAEIVRSLPRATVVTATDAYLHAEVRSALFRFVDDVEFLVDAEAKVLHVRSAARAGSSDLGVNRRRVEAIRARWEARAR